MRKPGSFQVRKGGKVEQLLKKIADTTHGRVRFLIKVTSEKTHAPLPDLAITLQGDNTFEKLAISPEGFLTVPLSQAAYDDHADFMSNNKKKGSLRVEFFLLPTLTGESIRYADVAESIESARVALAQILPWYVRLVMPSIKHVGFCYPDKQQTVAISNGAETARPALTEETNPVTQGQVYCSKFSLSEKGLGQDSLIAPAGGWVGLFL